MASSEETSLILPWRRGLWWFLAVESLCLIGFLLCLYFRQTALALLFLVGPVHVLVVTSLFRSNILLLSFFAGVFPLTMLELLPHFYREMGLYGGILGLIAFLLMTKFVVSDSKEKSRLGPGEKIALLLVAVCVLSSGTNAFLNGYGSMRMIRYSVVMLIVVLAVWIFAVVPDSVSQVRTLTYMMAFSCALTCFALPFLLGSMGSKVFVTTFGDGNLNLVGMSVGSFAAVLLGALFDSGRKRSKGFLVVAVVVLLAVLAYTRSRGAWLGFGFAFLYILARTRSFKPLVLAAGVGAVLLSLDVFRFAILVRVEQTGVQDPSLMGRFVLWKTALEAIKSNWLIGLGVENFRFLKYNYGFPVLMDPLNWHGAHNMFLEAFVSLGIVGGASFTLMPIVSFLRLDRLARRRRSFGARGLVIGLNAGVVAYAIHCLLDSPGWHAPTFSLWGILLGLSLAMARVSENKSGVAVCRDVV
mgnify:CR=1 FL=1